MEQIHYPYKNALWALRPAKPLGVLSRHPCRNPKPLPRGEGLCMLGWLCVLQSLVAYTPGILAGAILLGLPPLVPVGGFAPKQGCFGCLSKVLHDAKPTEQAISDTPYLNKQEVFRQSGPAYVPGYFFVLNGLVKGAYDCYISCCRNVNRQSAQYATQRIKKALREFTEKYVFSFISAVLLALSEIICYTLIYMVKIRTKM